MFCILYLKYLLNAFYTALMTEWTGQDIGDAVKLPKDSSHWASTVLDHET